MADDQRPAYAPVDRRRVSLSPAGTGTCPDARERGATRKHVLAVRMWKLRHDATAPAPFGPAPAAELLRHPVRQTDPFGYCARGIVSERPARLCDACADRKLALGRELFGA